MMIHLTSSIQYLRPQGYSKTQTSKLNRAITILAIVILLGCAAYWVYTNFWGQRGMMPQSPRQQPDPVTPLFKKAHSPIGQKGENGVLPAEEDSVEISPDQPPAKEDTPSEPPKEQPLHEKAILELAASPSDQNVARKKGYLKKGAKGQMQKGRPILYVSQLPIKQDDRTKIEKRASSGKTELIDENTTMEKSLNQEEAYLDFSAGEEKEDLAIDESLTIEENVEQNLSQYLEQERRKYSYGGVFYRYEGVYAALKSLKIQNKHDYVNFCNTAFVEHFEKNKNSSYLWDLYISINPDQIFEAWKILCDEIEGTGLAILGAIQSSEKCQPGKEIILQFLISDYPKQKELAQFLTLLAHHLAQQSILIDIRPLSQEPLLGTIPCEGLPCYFTYGTDTFAVVDDQIWDSLLVGRQRVETILDGKIVKLDEDPKVMIKASHYHTLGDARINPLSLSNPFETLKLKNLAG